MGRIRATHLAAVVRLTPHTMAANIVSGGVVIWAFAPQVSGAMWAWYALLVLTSLFGLYNWWSRRHRNILTAKPSALYHASAHAAILSSVWAVVTVVWFPHASGGQQMVIATLVTGMIGAGGFVLYPVPTSSAIYIVIFTAASLTALWLADDPLLFPVALLVMAYSPMVLMAALTAWSKSTELIQARTRAHKQELLVADLLSDFEQNAEDTRWEVDPRGWLVHISPKLCEILGITEEFAKSQPLANIMVGLNIVNHSEAKRIRDTRSSFSGLVLTFRGPTGERHIQYNGKTLFDASGAFAGWRGVATDVTEKVQNQELLRRLAHTDSLTGLTNRFMLRERLTELLRDKQPLALMAIDLDRFKAINDQHGHSTGDEILKLVAHRVQNQLSDGAIIARLGGDEFAVVLTSPADLDNASGIANGLVDLLAQPFAVQERALSIGGSIGLAFCHHGELSLDELMVQADISLYAAKESGRNKHVAFSAELGEKVQRRMTIEQDLRQALRQGELQLFWQPKVDLSTWRIVGAEALMRWKHKDYGWISPGEFIPIAEQGGSIADLGLWALHEACRLQTHALANIRLSVNVSPLQFLEDGFVPALEKLLADYDVQPGNLELELTESVFLDNADKALSTLHAVRKTGVKLALDDFGTGYSSLSYLRSFPFDTLKVDRAFVIELETRSNAVALVQLIAGLAEVLGMRTVCEGVETQEQLEAVRKTGCMEVQGFLIAKPMPLQDFVQFLGHWEKSMAQTTPVQA